MKNDYFLKVRVLAILLVILPLSQSFASGMKDDPVENYYNTYYGMDSLVDVNSSNSMLKAESTVSLPAFYPNNAYYSTFYEVTEEGKNTQKSLKPEADLINEMSDPRNFY
ncbi:MAG: hypothetical protein DSZ29_03600 [Aquificaceae bacterium]|nr:MAG: hypothetical protein DSZ29_03600 [Aquificaceae bacterium]